MGIAALHPCYDRAAGRLHVTFSSSAGD